MRLVTGALACCALALAGCGPRPLDSVDHMTCSRLAGVAPNALRLIPIAYGDANLETCAAHLEARRLIEHRDLIGVYSGLFIFVNARSITAANKQDGPRYLLIAPTGRVQLDAAIRDLMENDASPPR
jgi:hypothetical protein